MEKRKVKVTNMDKTWKKQHGQEQTALEDNASWHK